jgi:hypothetical protein
MSRCCKQRSLQLDLMSPGLSIFSWDSPKLSNLQILTMVPGGAHQHFQKCLLDSSNYIATSISVSKQTFSSIMLIMA